LPLAGGFSVEVASAFFDLAALFGVLVFLAGGRMAGGRLAAGISGLSGSYAGCSGDLGILGVEAVGFGVHLVALPVLLGAMPNDVGVCGSPTSRK
jgi:hypothetical protein